MGSTKKLRGMGGHMDAALVHDIVVLNIIYQRQINEALIKRKFGVAASLAKTRDYKISRVRDRLMERGYYRK